MAGRRRIVTALVLVLRLAVGALLVLLALGVSLGVVVGVARASSNPAVVLAGGWAALMVGIAIAIVIATWSSPMSTPQRATAVLAGLVIVSLVAGIAVLQPLGRAQPPPDVEGMEVVDLPTGSRIAYAFEPAPGEANTDPIVFVHGGPGFADMAGDLPFVREVADGRHDLLVYDEVGAGHSGRLDDPTGYSLERDRADLTALLDHLGMQRAIVIGYSYGASVAAAFAARAPDRVARLIFLAPGPIRPHAVDYGNGMVGRLPIGKQLALYARLLQPRALLAYVLSQANPRAAHALVGDGELDAYYRRIHELAAPGLYCTPPADLSVAAGIGFYTNMAARQVPDLRPALAAVTAPTIVLKPQCDYLPWTYGTELAAAIPGAQLVYVRGAGHAIYVEQHDQVLAELHAFLDGQPLPIPAQPTLERPADVDSP